MAGQGLSRSTDLIHYRLMRKNLQAPAYQTALFVYGIATLCSPRVHRALSGPHGSDIPNGSGFIGRPPEYSFLQVHEPHPRKRWHCRLARASTLRRNAFDAINPFRKIDPPSINSYSAPSAP
jgi:hypothetical protein